MSDRYEQVLVASRSEWRRWLEANHAVAPGVWAVTFKKRYPGHVGYEDLVEEALAFGWIDSKGRSVDEQRTALLMTPRKPNSGWSRPNKERIERLTAAGVMAPAGIAAVETAKANGSWTALDDVENLIEPEDLRTALDADADARRHYDAFPRSAKRAILVWIAGAKKPETRAKRVAETVSKAAQNTRANP